MNREKLLALILSGTSDTNIPFGSTCNLLQHLGFEERVVGNHHLFTYPGVQALLNLQPRQGKVKPYQVKQARDFLRRYLGKQS